MPTDATLTRIREDFEAEIDEIYGIGFLQNATPGIRQRLADLQHRTWDAGYAAGIEAAKAELLWAQGSNVEAADASVVRPFVKALRARLDALKAVPRG